jgi:hypothetical protein
MGSVLNLLLHNLKRSSTCGEQIMEVQRTDNEARMGEMAKWYKMSLIKIDEDVGLDVMIILKRTLKK